MHYNSNIILRSISSLNVNPIVSACQKFIECLNTKKKYVYFTAKWLNWVVNILNCPRLELTFLINRTHRLRIIYAHIFSICSELVGYSIRWLHIYTYITVDRNDWANENENISKIVRAAFRSMLNVHCAIWSIIAHLPIFRMFRIRYRVQIVLFFFLFFFFFSDPIKYAEIELIFTRIFSFFMWFKSCNMLNIYGTTTRFLDTRASIQNMRHDYG